MVTDIETADLHWQNRVVASENPTYYDLFEVLSRHSHPVILIDANVAGAYPEFVLMCEARSIEMIRVPRNAQQRILELLQPRFDAAAHVVVAVGGISILRLAERLLARTSVQSHLWYVPTTLVPQIQACVSQQLFNHSAPTTQQYCYINPTFLRTIPEELLYEQVTEGLVFDDVAGYLRTVLDRDQEMELFDSVVNVVRDLTRPYSASLIRSTL